MPWLCAVLGLLVGVWLALVVERLPRMMEHDWENQCREAREQPPLPAAARPRLWAGLGQRDDHGAPGGARRWRIAATAGLTALLWAACAWRFGPTPAALCAMACMAVLLVLAWIDLRTGLLPDILTLPLLWAGLLVNTAHAYTTAGSAILGAAVGYVFLWLLFHGFRLVTGREGMGYGDFKLLAALGAWLGLASLPWLLLSASVAGVVVGLALILTRRAARGQPQPFGPFLAAAGIVGLLAAGTPPWWIW